jgi:hypothetical protein
MGRQIPVVLVETDEQMFVDFLRSTGDVRVFESFADTVDALEVVGLPPPTSGHLFFNIWPTRFPWRPEFSQTRTAPSQWYVSNTGVAPVLEYSRVPLNGLRPGRLYWADRFSGEPPYDRRAFGDWIDSVWSWVRARANRTAFADHTAWCFPGAAGVYRLNQAAR